MEVDYEKVEKINEGLDHCNKRRKEIDKQIKKLPLSFGNELIEISNKMALEGYDQELKQIDKQYQYLLKERDKCFEETNKEVTK